MYDNEINVLLFSLHITLLSTKLFALLFMAKFILKYHSSFLKLSIVYAFFLFTIGYTLMQAWFISNFFNDIDAYIYELMSIVDQVVFSILAVFYLIKEVECGKNENECYRKKRWKEKEIGEN